MAPDATQYLLPDLLGLDAALDRLAAHFQLGRGPARSTERTFYDTFDGRLHAADLALIGEAGRLVAATATGYRELASAPAQAAERILVKDLPGGPLRDLIAPIIEMRALRPTVRTQGRTLALSVHNREAKTVVRLVLEAAVGHSGAGEPDLPLRSRLHVAGVRGYDRPLARVRRVLVEDLGLEATDLPLHDEAVRAAGGSPGGFSTKLNLRLAADVPARTGAAIALVEMLRTIELTLPGTLADLDGEFLHDLRVAVRRTRSIQRQLAAIFPPDQLAWFRAEFGWLGQVTGPTRDLDVLLLDFARLQTDLPAARAVELAPMGELLRARRELERRRMVGALESERTATLLADWTTFLAGLGGYPPIDGTPDRPLGALVGRRIRTVYRQMRRAGREVDETTPAVRLHDLRKQGKELRYLLEVFAGLYPPEAVRPTVKTLKALQETLGQFQDREVQASTLRALGTELAATAGGPAALLALGVVLERVEADSSRARAEFAERFAVYSAPDQKALIHRTFR